MATVFTTSTTHKTQRPSYLAARTSIPVLPSPILPRCTYLYTSRSLSIVLHTSIMPQCHSATKGSTRERVGWRKPPYTGVRMLSRTKCITFYILHSVVIVIQFLTMVACLRPGRKETPPGCSFLHRRDRFDTKTPSPLRRFPPHWGTNRLAAAGVRRGISGSRCEHGLMKTPMCCPD